MMRDMLCVFQGSHASASLQVKRPAEDLFRGARRRDDASRESAFKVPQTYTGTRRVFTEVSKKEL